MNHHSKLRHNRNIRPACIFAIPQTPLLVCVPPHTWRAHGPAYDALQRRLVTLNLMQTIAITTSASLFHVGVETQF